MGVRGKNRTLQFCRGLSRGSTRTPSGRTRSSSKTATPSTAPSTQRCWVVTSHTDAYVWAMMIWRWPLRSFTSVRPYTSSDVAGPLHPCSVYPLHPLRSRHVRAVWTRVASYSNRKSCFAQSDPNRYYLVADLAEGRIDLKAGARLLNRWTILAVQPTQAGVSRLTFEQHIEPVTHEPGPTRGRLGGRVLPLDFRGRLIEGPRRPLGYIFPNVPDSGQLPVPIGCGRGSPVRWGYQSLASALTPGTPAILISAPMTPR